MKRENGASKKVKPSFPRALRTPQAEHAESLPKEAAKTESKRSDLWQWRAGLSLAIWFPF